MEVRCFPYKCSAGSFAVPFDVKAYKRLRVRTKLEEKFMIVWCFAIGPAKRIFHYQSDSMAMNDRVIHIALPLHSLLMAVTDGRNETFAEANFSQTRRGYYCGYIVA